MLLALGACSDDSPRAARSDISAPSTAAADSPAAESEDGTPSSQPPGTSQPEATEPDPPPVLGRRARDLRHRLLTAGQLPPISPRTDWRGTGVSASEQEDFALCHPFSLTAIGAEQVRARSFVDTRSPAQDSPREPARAGHLLATFPDARTTGRAASVLEAWHERCERRLAQDAHRVRVRDRVSVEGLPGPASWYRTRIKARPGAVPVIEVTGTVRVGSQVGVVVLRHRKGTYTPAVGETQVVEALQRTAASLS